MLTKTQNVILASFSIEITLIYLSFSVPMCSKTMVTIFFTYDLFSVESEPSLILLNILLSLHIRKNRFLFAADVSYYPVYLLKDIIDNFYVTRSRSPYLNIVYTN